MGVPAVRVVLAAIAAYNERDVERLSLLMTPDVDLRPPVMALAGNAYRGHAGIREWLADLDESFAEARIEPLEVTEVDGLVLALTSFRIEGGESRVRFESELGLVCELREGRVSSWTGHLGHDEARADAAARSAR